MYQQDIFSRVALGIVLSLSLTSILWITVRANSNPTIDSCCFSEQETLSSLLSTGWYWWV